MASSPQASSHGEVSFSHREGSVWTHDSEPLPQLSIAQYCQQYGVNPDSGEPYRLTGYEYLTGILDSLAPRIVLMKAAQVGATVMAMLRTLWFLEAKQKSCMYLFPTHRSAARFRQGRFSVMVQRSPFFRSAVRPTGAPGQLRVGMAQFYCHGARSRVELMSSPVAYLTLDERDELYRAAGLENTPWSAVDLARQRLSGQPESWELSLSTPTIPGYGIAAEFARSWVFHFEVKCPHCQRPVTPSWPAGVAGIEGPWQRACFCCPHCRALWTHIARRQIIARGLWRSPVPASPGQAEGYHLSQLLSPVARASRLVQQWQEAQGDPAALQIFHNAVLGLPYLAEGARLAAATLEAAIARSEGRKMAATARFTAAGIDVGPRLLHIVITQKQQQQCHILWAGVVLDWQALRQVLETYGVVSYVVDAQPETHEARRLVHECPGGWMCYYRSDAQAQPVYDGTQHILRVPRSESLDALYRAWNTGRVVAPVDLPGEFAAQLQSPARVVRQARRGMPQVEYLESAGPDHYAHAMNYSLLALGLLTSSPQMQIFV